MKFDGRLWMFIAFVTALALNPEAYAIGISGGTSATIDGPESSVQGASVVTNEGMVSQANSIGPVSEFADEHEVADGGRKYAFVRLWVKNGQINDYRTEIIPKDYVSPLDYSVPLVSIKQWLDVSNAEKISIYANAHGGWATPTYRLYVPFGPQSVISDLVIDKGSLGSYTGYIVAKENQATSSQSGYCPSAESFYLSGSASNAYGKFDALNPYGTIYDGSYVDAEAKTVKELNFNSHSSAWWNGAASNAESHRRTESFISVDGKADSGRMYSEATYASESPAKAYGAKARAEWLGGTVDSHASAKIVKSAVADLELTTSGSSKSSAWTFTNDKPNYEYMYQDNGGVSSIKTTAWNGEKFQTHLYSHAYPKNDNHDIDEYVSTGSTGIKGKDASMMQSHWDDNLNHWNTNWNDKSGVIYTSGSDSRVIKTVDIKYRNYDNSGNPLPFSSKVGLWDVPTRPKNQPDDTVPWGIEMMYNNGELKSTSGGKGVDVAVIDSGVDTLHPDLVMRVEDYSDSGMPVEYGDSRSDPGGHGTHVAGTIAADGGFNGKGIWGMAPEANLNVYKYDHSAEDFAKGIYRSTDLGADIISLSQGTYHINLIDRFVINQAIEYAAANNVLLVAAAGNGLDPKNPTPSIGYPAENSNVIAVGAVDSKGNAAWWSSPGSNDGGDIIGAGDVMFGAPGVDILSTYPTYGIKNPDNGKTYSWYTLSSGTSMATPHISGAAAKTLSENLWQGYSGRDVIDIMKTQAKNNDVGKVVLSEDDVEKLIKYQDDIKVYANDNSMSNSVQNYYSELNNAITSYQNRPWWHRAYDGIIWNWEYDISLPGNDCLTGLGIPKRKQIGGGGGGGGGW